MKSLFFQLGTDRIERAIDLEDRFAGPFPTSCWLIGGGVSLLSSPTQQIADSPMPKMGINLSGSRLLRPTFWTSYDPTVRFHRSVYLDAGVMKFVHRRRAMDLVQGTNFKVCDCPNLYFFDRDAKYGFSDFLSRKTNQIVDWADSMVQAIDILYRLGFRRIYCVGCEMRISPSDAQREAALEKQIVWEQTGRLKGFVDQCRSLGLSAEMLDRLPSPLQYHFGESKPIEAAANTDEHYFRTVQSLRLCRRAMTSAGLELISVTPKSRLNDYFKSMTVEEAIERELAQIGDPQQERTVGQYVSKDVVMQTNRFGTMKDVSPFRHSQANKKQRGNCNDPPVPEKPFFDDACEIDQEQLAKEHVSKEQIRKGCAKLLNDDIEICEEA